MRLRTIASAGVSAGVLWTLPASGAVRPPPSGSVVYDLGNRLELSNLDGTNKRFLAATIGGSAAVDGSPSWSPDGSSVAFTRGGDVYVVRVADGLVRRVARRAPYSGAPRWSADGARLAFGWSSRTYCAGHPRDRAVLIADAAGAGAAKLGSVERRPFRRAVGYSVLEWSPDGRRLLYSEERWRAGGDCGLLLGDNFRGGDLFHIGAGGGRPTPIQGARTGQGRWSPDGRFIAFAGERCAVSVASVNGRRVRTWRNERNEGEGCYAGSEQWLAWSHSGDEVYAATDVEVVALRVRDGRRRVLFSGPDLSCSAEVSCGNFIRAVSADGRWVVLEASGGAVDGVRLYAVATDGTGHLRLPYPARGAFSIFLP